MAQTAMQELVKWMEDSSTVIPFDQEYCYNKAIELLQKEEEQIKKAYGNVLFDDNGNFMTGEQYYNETYRK